MRSFQRPGRSPVYAEHAVIATSHPLASEVGLSVLKAGGNAVDAALAAVATLCVVEPAMTGIGGDCFALYLPAGAARPIALNGSGRAPAAADPAWYADQGITKIDRFTPHAVTVPGAVAAWELLNRDHGRTPLADLLAPAIAYARDGFPIYPRVYNDWVLNEGILRADAVAGEVLLVNGSAPALGGKFRQPRLADSLAAIAREGRDGFYTGAVAEDIVARLRGLGGLHTLDDFASASAEYVDPIQGRFAGHDVFECPPNGQGLCALMIMNILDGYDWPSLSEVDQVHILAEAAKLGYHQRDAYIGDPAQVDVPVERLLSTAHGDRLRAMIDPARAGIFHPSDFPTHPDTVYLAVVDADGNAISFINSIFSSFGSTIMAPGSGVLLHNRGEAFNLTAGHANCIAPGKRPMHTIIPGFLMKDGKPVGPFGVMGGQYQSVGQSAFLTNLLRLGMDPQAALDAPRSFAYAGGLQMEETFSPESYVALGHRGHLIERMNIGIGGGQAVIFDHANGMLIGGSDPRKDGAAIGY